MIRNLTLVLILVLLGGRALAASESDADRKRRESAEATFAARELAKAQDTPLRLSTLTTEQIADVFTRVKNTYWMLPENTLLAVRKPMTLENGRRTLTTDEETLAAHNLVAIQATISGTAGRDGYLIDNNDAMLVIPGRQGLPEDTYVTGYAVVDGTYEYVTVMGAGRRIRKYRMEGEALTVERFLQEVKAGTPFFCMWEVALPCAACRGTKTIEMKPCDRCRGKGKVNQQCLKSVVK